MICTGVRAHPPKKNGLGVELEISKLELLIRCDNVYVP